MAIAVAPAAAIGRTFHPALDGVASTTFMYCKVEVPPTLRARSICIREFILGKVKRSMPLCGAAVASAFYYYR
jgi:hypothetical protein